MEDQDNNEDFGQTVIDAVEGKYKEHKAKEENKGKRRLALRIADILDSGLTGIAVVVYIIVSLLIPEASAPSGYSNWAIYWTVIFLGSIPGGIMRAIVKRNFNSFPITQMALFAYFFTAMYTGIFHPYWVILLAIPAYYSIFSPIQRLINDHKAGRI